MNIKDLAPGSYTVKQATSTPTSTPTPTAKLNIRDLAPGSYKPVEKPATGFVHDLANDATKTLITTPVIWGAQAEELLRAKMFGDQAAQQKAAEFATTPKTIDYSSIPLIGKTIGKVTVNPANDMRDVAGQGLKAASWLYAPKPVQGLFSKPAVGTLAKVLNYSKNVGVPGAIVGGSAALGQSLQDHNNLPDTVKNTLEGAGVGFGVGIGGELAVKGASKVLGGAKKATNMVTAEGRSANAVSDNKKNLQVLTDSYQGLRNVDEKAKARGVDVKDIISKTDLLHGTVDETGTIRTQAPREALQKFLSEGPESVIKDTLAREGGSVTPEALKAKMTEDINKSSLTGSRKQAALNKVESEVKGLSIDADANGNIPLSVVHAAKSDIYSTINYLGDPAGAKADKVIAKSLKEVVENNTKSADVKALNKELQAHYAVLDYLNKLDGKKVEGGRLGKHFARITGSIVGSHFGPLGSLIGSEVGGGIKGAIMKGKFGGKTGNYLKSSEAMLKAIEKNQSSKSVGSLNIPQSKQTIANTAVMPSSVPKKKVFSNTVAVDSADHLSQADQEAAHKWLIKQPDETKRQIYQQAKERRDMIEAAYQSGIEKYRAISKYFEGGKNSPYKTLPEMGVKSNRNLNGRVMAKNGAPLRFKQKGDTFIDELGFKDAEDAQNFVDNFTSIMEQRKMYQQEEMKLRGNTPGYNKAYGMFAGMQPTYDDKGNVTGMTFDPKMAIAGVAVGHLAPQLRDKVGKFAKEDAIKAVESVMKKPFTNTVNEDIVSYSRIIKEKNYSNFDKEIARENLAKTLKDHGLFNYEGKLTKKDDELLLDTADKAGSFSDELAAREAAKAEDTVTQDMMKERMGMFPKDVSIKNEALKFDNGEDFYQKMSNSLRDTLREKGIRGNEQVSKYWEDITGKKSIDSYKMSHRPTESGAYGSDITMKGEFIPKDAYEHPEYYFDMKAKTDYGVATRESWDIIKSIRNKPNATITIYRASPSKDINNGDWITLSKKYAKLHAKDSMPIHSFKVKAKDIQFAGDDINEFGYFPSKESLPKNNK